MKRSIEQRNSILGYYLGFMIFICIIPGIMVIVAGHTSGSVPRTLIMIVLAVIGISLSVWSIVYMKKVGEGNPLDAFNHEVGPRTKKLMTEGPYRICRNPMLLGTFIYYAGIQIRLLSWKALIIYVLFIAIMAVQVKKEE